MTILLTGATGLVGSRLLKRFAAAGLECRGLVRAGKTLPQTATVEGDVLSPDSLDEAMQGVSAIVHLAASFRSRNDDETWQVNLDGTQNLIAAASKNAPGARFVMASTSNVYGEGGSHPGRETDDVNPSLAYPASKVHAERALRASSLTWAILRLPFVYGDGDGHLDTAPELFAEMNWHPAQRQSMGHHEDVATAFRLALSGVMDGRIVNIADESPLTVYEIAQVLGQRYPSSGRTLDDPWRGCADVTLARSLGFRPAVRTLYQAIDEGKL